MNTREAAAELAAHHRRHARAAEAQAEQIARLPDREQIAALERLVAEGRRRQARLDFAARAQRRQQELFR